MGGKVEDTKTCNICKHEFNKWWNAFVPGTVLGATSATLNSFCPCEAYISGSGDIKKLTNKDFKTYIK